MNRLDVDTAHILPLAEHWINIKLKQQKIHSQNTAVADKFILIWFTNFLRICIPVITQMSFYLLIL